MERYYRATSVADACEQLAGDDTAELIAGGQTLTLHLRQGLKSPDRLIDISRIGDLSHITDHGEAIGIGSAVTYEVLRESPLIKEEFPYFAAAIDHIAGPQVRANGTIGGGLCYGDPALDTPPVLLTLDAEVTLRSQSGERTLPLSEFFTGYYATAREPDELLVEITVPKLPPNSYGSYRTMAPRQGDYAIAGVAVRGTFDGQSCTAARIGLTNAGETPKRAEDAEAVIEGSAVDSAAVEQAVDALDSALDLIGDEQVSKAYQETVFRRLATQAIQDVATANETARDANAGGEGNTNQDEIDQQEER